MSRPHKSCVIIFLINKVCYLKVEYKKTHHNINEPSPRISNFDWCCCNFKLCDYFWTSQKIVQLIEFVTVTTDLNLKNKTFCYYTFCSKNQIKVIWQAYTAITNELFKIFNLNLKFEVAYISIKWKKYYHKFSDSRYRQSDCHCCSSLCIEACWAPNSCFGVWIYKLIWLSWKVVQLHY